MMREIKRYGWSMTYDDYIEKEDGCLVEWKDHLAAMEAKDQEIDQLYKLVEVLRDKWLDEHMERIGEGDVWHLHYIGHKAKSPECPTCKFLTKEPK